MSALVITREVPYTCPNCDATMIAELTMRHGITQKQADEVADFESVKQYSSSVLERCVSCDYTNEESG